MTTTDTSPTPAAAGQKTPPPVPGSVDPQELLAWLEQEARRSTTVHDQAPATWPLLLDQVMSARDLHALGLPATRRRARNRHWVQHHRSTLAAAVHGQLAHRPETAARMTAAVLLLAPTGLPQELRWCRELTAPVLDRAVEHTLWREVAVLTELTLCRGIPAGQAQHRHAHERQRHALALLTAHPDDPHATWPRRWSTASHWRRARRHHRAGQPEHARQVLLELDILLEGRPVGAAHILPTPRAPLCPRRAAVWTALAELHLEDGDTGAAVRLATAAVMSHDAHEQNAPLPDRIAALMVLAYAQALRTGPEAARSPWQRARALATAASTAALPAADRTELHQQRPHLGELPSCDPHASLIGRYRLLDLPRTHPARTR
ncbi:MULTISPECIES: hypothetical protein [Actinosynnema]|uniref:hypothetical protein n=1 Tax=Actinosynnema TaxID=40566 RepID=UPI0020A44551|nr:hypothetical protein [Actinosynnema pretiosum]MCP2097303.1 hypothetical protein [Actinosynnema pretiosum]